MDSGIVLYYVLPTIILLNCTAFSFRWQKNGDAVTEEELIQKSLHHNFYGNFFCMVRLIANYDLLPKSQEISRFAN